METSRKFIIAKLFLQSFITDEDSNLRIESFAIINIHGEYNASLALWKHHVIWLLQSFSCKAFIAKLYQWWRFELTDRKLCNNKFTWCFRKAKLVTW